MAALDRIYCIILSCFVNSVDLDQLASKKPADLDLQFSTLLINI